MTKVIDFANLDFAALRKSVDLESRADLFAVAGNFGEASAYMKEANRVRREQFGNWNPNELRDFTSLALAQAGEAGTAATTKIDAVHEHAVPEGNAPNRDKP